MRRLTFVLAACTLAMNQANADLVINGVKSSTSPVTPATTTNYTPVSSFQSCIANLRGKALSSGVTAATFSR